MAFENDWTKHTRDTLAAARDAGALPVLTVGAVEQHAEHLPVDMDSASAYAIAMAALCGASGFQAHADRERPWRQQGAFGR